MLPGAQNCNCAAGGAARRAHPSHVTGPERSSGSGDFFVQPSIGASGTVAISCSSSALSAGTTPRVRRRLGPLWPARLVLLLLASAVTGGATAGDVDASEIFRLRDDFDDIA